jgi:ubiquinone/menaquinone biosynthesis C-methylase UbiE
VLDVGCGVATTALTVAHRFAADVTAVDIEPLMLERAQNAVEAAGVKELVHLQEGDILALEFPDSAFDVVIAEAVTMFVDRARAARELIRVCRPGGRVLATEFMWRRPPSEEAREAFLGQVCPGLRFDTAEDWVRIYTEAGLSSIEIDEGPFEMMTPKGFVQDEGVTRALSVMGRVMTRPAYMRKMIWLMPRMKRAVPFLGYIVVSGKKPA